MARKTNTEINGKKYFRVTKTIGRDKEGKPIKKQFYGNSKRDAELKYEEWLNNYNAGIKEENKSLSESMYTWLWEVEKMSGNKDSTFSNYESTYRNYIEKSKIGYRILNEIDRMLIQSYYNDLHKDGKSFYQIESTHKLISKFFKYCYLEGYIKRNPCEGIKISVYKERKTTAEDEGKVETFSEDEIKVILNHVNKNVKLRVLIKFALFTGLRQGEILSLRVRDIEDMTVSVSKAVKHVKVFTSNDNYEYETQTNTPKTDASVRKVPIPSILTSDLKELELLRKKEKLKAGDAYKENNLLFPSEVGTHISARNLLRAWKSIFTYINIPYRKFHALRHTYATLLIKKGTPILTVSRLLGHTSIRTTQIYAHVVEETKKSEVEKLNEVLSR